MRLASLEIEKMKAAGERKHGPAVFAQRHRADLGGHIPGAHLAAVGGAAEYVAAEAVDEIEPLLLDIPPRTLAKNGLDVDQHFDAHDVLPCLSQPANRGSGNPRTPRP